MYPWHYDGNKIFRNILIVQFVAAIVIGFITSQLTVAVILGVPIVALPLILSVTQPGRFITQVCQAVGTQLMTALHIHLSFGLIEMHFEIFVLLAFLAYFRDWRVIAAATAVVAVHHIGFFFMQQGGTPVYIFETGHITYGILLLHAGFALTEGAVLMLMAHKAKQEGEAGLDIRVAIQKMLESDDSINLDVPINTRTNNGKQLQRLITQIAALVEKSRHLTGELATATSHISLSADYTRTFSESAVGEIALISSSSEEIAVSTAQAAEQTHKVSDLTNEATGQIDASKQMVNSTGQTIESLRATLNEAATTNEELNQHCAAISETMRNITAVADQTNLLALNAAIESARAGEHGRGFAVVADEVRTLAIRSKASADQISDATEQLLVSTQRSVEQMQSCISLVDEAVNNSGHASVSMEEIALKVAQVSELMEESSSSATEQQEATSSIAQSNTRLQQIIDEGSGHSITLTEQVDKLNQLSDSMHNTLIGFK